MVTGVETAGLVLAVLPLLIEALKSYKGGLEKTQTIAGLTERSKKRLKLKVQRLIWRLRSQQVHFETNLTKLFRLAAPDAELQDLPHDFNDPLWSGETGLKVKAYLSRSSDDAFDSFLDTLQLYQSYLEDIAENLCQISRPKGAKNNDLVALLKANPKSGTTFRLRARVSFVMKETDLDKLLDDLNEATLSIERFVTLSQELEQIEVKSGPASKSNAKVVPLIRRIRNQAGTLFNVLARAWKVDCHPSHNALLCLDSRHSSAVKHLKTGGDIDFRLLLCAQPPSAASKLWHEAYVTVNEFDDSGTVGKVANASVPALSITPVNTNGSAQQPLKDIDDICTVISQNNKDQKLIIKFSPDGDILSCKRSPCGKESLSEDPDTMSLEEFLNSRHRMEPVRRIRLATILASSLLQLNGTSWLRTHWNKQGILFFQDQHAVSTIDSDHPFIIKSFPYEASLDKSKNAARSAESALVELGILLLEIWHRRTFEFWVSSELQVSFDTSDPDMRELYAWKWFKRVQDDLVPAYRDVIDVCLRPPSDFNTTNWELDDFQKLYYSKIMVPLMASQL